VFTLGMAWAAVMSSRAFKTSTTEKPFSEKAKQLLGKL